MANKMPPIPEATDGTPMDQPPDDLPVEPPGAK